MEEAMPTPVVDLVLSSGFLAFAAQAGFLRAVEQSGLQVHGVCGTSSGALAGALWAAGMPAETVFERLTERIPLRQVRPGWRRPWRGMFTLDSVIATLREDLPERFEDLGRPFGAGVMDARRRPFLLTTGSLPEAVAASCAIPRLFAPVAVGGQHWADGGIVERTALRAWQARRPEAETILHLVDRSAKGSAPDAQTLERVAVVVASPSSGAKLWTLGDARSRFERTRRLALAALTTYPGLRLEEA